MTRDDSYSPFRERWSGPPSPVLVQRLWRVQKAHSANVLSCGLYLHPHGIEARCGYRDEDAHAVISLQVKLAIDFVTIEQ